MAWVAFHKWKQAQFDNETAHGAVDFNTDTIQIVLLTDAVNPSTVVDTAEDINDLDATEVSGTNYARKTIGNVTVTLAGGTITVDGDNPTAYSEDVGGFADARYAILIKNSGDDATSSAIAYHDFSTNKGNTTGDLTLELDDAGIFKFA